MMQRMCKELRRMHRMQKQNQRRRPDAHRKCRGCTGRTNKKKQHMAWEDVIGSTKQIIDNLNDAFAWQFSRMLLHLIANCAGHGFIFKKQKKTIFLDFSFQSASRPVSLPPGQGPNNSQLVTFITPGQTYEDTQKKQL